MKRTRKANLDTAAKGVLPGYDAVLSGVVDLLDSARRAGARAVNAIMTATYWEIGRRIVEFEQGGEERAQYGNKMLQKLAGDLTKEFGRGFGYVNLTQMRRFYLAWPPEPILQTASEESPIHYKRPVKQKGPARKLQTVSEEFKTESSKEISQTMSAQSAVGSRLALRPFPLPWSHYVLLLKVDKPEARAFYEAEALRCGWTVRQLDRQISTLFYERTLASRNKGAMLKKGAAGQAGEELTPEEEIKDPLVLEFLGLKDEYSESQLEEALIRQLESFLLELGGDFAFVARQRRLRIGDEWYRIDLLFYHRRLRCLVVIDLKLGKFTHADAGQMHLYLSYARQHWTHADENPPVGIILCTQQDHALAHYALDGLPNKVLAAEYKTALPDERTLAAELEHQRRLLESRTTAHPRKSERGRAARQASK